MRPAVMVILTSLVFVSGTGLAQVDVDEECEPEVIRDISDYQKYVGRYIGKDSERASLTKAISGVGYASNWRQGTLVQGNDTPIGTPIATFNFGDRYGPSVRPGGHTGVSRTGIYLGQSSAGILILHQWDKSGGARISTIPWNSWSGKSTTAGSRYYTIM